MSAAREFISGQSTRRHLLQLPDAPLELTAAVQVWREPVSMVTYAPERPDRNPMFLERRVYQGSSGKVYPLPFIERIATEPEDRLWDAIHLQNKYVRLMILPEIGGRIHVGLDRVSGYDFFYRQNVIKPALVGLAGPWISGGVEFNWPQHHRPATFMPVNTAIEEGTDGSVTVWCSDHDPMLRMKGMHGVCLHPERALVELKVRLYNRTPLVQTFLWWANVATRVHENYQSFFPPDVRFVTDHAKRAVTSFPRSERPYYGVDYPARARCGVAAEQAPAHFVPPGSYAADDLSWYANIPVPTSYMAIGTKEDFFGGYDHQADAGLMHVADHHIAPGKKQWTWGNHGFGYAWDRSLTNDDGPYIELMAGVYTDNQPDFSFLAPWETKTFSQYWYPLRGTGVPQAANTEAALHVELDGKRLTFRLGVTKALHSATVKVQRGTSTVARWSVDLSVESPFTQVLELQEAFPLHELCVEVQAGGRTVLRYEPAAICPAETPQRAKEPAPAEEIESVEQLYLTGVHLQQYRHATRQPEVYWKEALKRDPHETRCLNAMGLWHLRRGELSIAQDSFERAIVRLTELNPNPYDGEAYYNLGMVLRLRGNGAKAYDAFFKATWNAAWRAPAYFALAEIDARRADWLAAEDHLARSLRAEADNLNALNLRGFVRRALGDLDEAEAITHAVLKLDPLDNGAHWAQGAAPSTGQERLDLSFDLLRAGREEEAQRVLKGADLSVVDGSGPMILLTLADLEAQNGGSGEAEALHRAGAVSRDFCFPHRLEELLVLERTVARHPSCALAWYLLGNLLYDRRRSLEAIAAWETAASQEPQFPTTWRNLGIAYFNVLHQEKSALQAFDRAVAIDSADGRLLFERDQLLKRMGTPPEARLRDLEAFPHLLQKRDDLSVELATLYNQLGRSADALALLVNRHFQPWEGGEGLVLAQYVRAHLLLGQQQLEGGDAAGALRHFTAARQPPLNLSEASHLLANQSDIDYWSGRAHQALDHPKESERCYVRAAQQASDFQDMSVREVSKKTLWRGLALLKLDRDQGPHSRMALRSEATALFEEIMRYAEDLEQQEPRIDYFATSLPAMLLFDEDQHRRQRIEAWFLRGQAYVGLGELVRARQWLTDVLKEDANHGGAHDLLRLLPILPPSAVAF